MVFLEVAIMVNHDIYFFAKVFVRRNPQMNPIALFYSMLHP
jgi:hypothetical protein